MNIIKSVALWTLYFIAICVLSSLVIKILGVIFNVSFENIVLTGVRVGLIVWMFLFAHHIDSVQKSKSISKINQK